MIQLVYEKFVDIGEKEKLEYNILVVEDDKNTNEVISNFLRNEKYVVDSAYTGEEGLLCFGKKEYHLILLDVMLPGIGGVEVLKKIREKCNVPVIMLTAVADELIQLICFENKVDEYVVKPFSPSVLVKRINVLLERIYGEEIVKICGYDFDFSGYTVSYNDNLISLTTKEIELIKILYENKKRVLSREQLLASLFGDDYEGLDRTIDTHVKNIRKKLDSSVIVTVKGVGYKLG